MANQTRLRREVFRKMFHALGLVIVLGYSFLRVYVGQRGALLALTGLLIALLEVEYVRLEHQFKLPGGVDRLLRSHEKDRVTGTIWLVAACIISFSVFDYPIAFLSFFFVIFGDMFASLVGVRFGTKKMFRKKSWAGFLAGLTINVLSGVFILPAQPLVYLSMALTASVVELLTSKLDDNFTVPLFAGFVGQALVSLAGFLN